MAILGHELRNPLSPILTALQLMRIRGGDVLLRERTVIERHVQHLTRLVDDLLDVSRLVEGRIELKKRPIELADVVARAIEMASPLIEARAHRLTADVPMTGLLVLADEPRLAQAIANLLTNAAKYTEPGGEIAMTAHAETRSKDTSTVRLQVRDNGLGISADLLPHIFDLFVQGTRTIDRRQGGLGLGLTIVKNLVALHGGKLGAHSGGPGQGSEFTIEMPAAAKAAPASHPRRRKGKLRAVPADERRPHRVLVVDDNVDAAEMLAEALELLGCETRVAFDGPSGLAAAAEFLPHVALLDIGLPVMDGFELARRMRELPACQETRLVAVTGYGLDSDRQRSESAGFDDHLVKPVDLDAVQEVVRRLCRPRDSQVSASGA